VVRVYRSGSIVGHNEGGDSAEGHGTSTTITGGAPCGGTLWRRSHGSEAHWCDQIIEDGGTTATITSARSLVQRSSWWLLSGGGKTKTEKIDHTAEKEHI
jgi:hypothetical protein